MLCSGGWGIYLLNAKWNPTSVPENPVQVQNSTIFPNPVNGIANIQFNLLKNGAVNINIYDPASNLIAPIFNGQLSAGIQNFQWNVLHFASGTYFCNIVAGGITTTITIIVNK